jgi:hypothetical protein
VEKNLTEIHSALSEVCGELTVDRSTVSRWANRFTYSANSSLETNNKIKLFLLNVKLHAVFNEMSKECAVSKGDITTTATL